MSIPQPSLNSLKGILSLIVAVALASAVLRNTGIGATIQSTLDALAQKVPV